MKLMRLGERGRETPAVLATQDEAIDVSSVAADFGPEFFAKGGIEKLRVAVADPSLPRVRLSSVRVGPPVLRPGKLLCIGKNFKEHAEEIGEAAPAWPIVFDKATSSIVGPYDDVVVPSNYAAVDYEVELALVIGRTAKRVDRASAMSHVAGYLVCNDVSERTAQLQEGGQWYRGKSFDTFAPLGPYLVTADEIADPHDLELTCRVDGEVRQRGSTRHLIFDIPALLAFISRNITLEPGDVLSTGTPSGVALGMRPPRYLLAGQVMELEVKGLGRQRSRLVREEP
jgi:2-keto-4-pentenoate hydratase/2-oxohepta-3-ene-1,7-dioic acid hydratase in catechol pathway